MLKYVKMQDSHAQIECNVSSPADQLPRHRHLQFGRPCPSVALPLYPNEIQDTYVPLDLNVQNRGSGLISAFGLDQRLIVVRLFSKKKHKDQQGITKVIGIHPLGIMNVCTKLLYPKVLEIFPSMTKGAPHRQCFLRIHMPQRSGFFNIQLCNVFYKLFIRLTSTESSDLNVVN